MAKRSVISWPTGRLFRQVVGPALLVSVLVSAPVAAQSQEQSAAQGGRSEAPAGCAVAAQPTEVDGVRTVQATCRGRIVILGDATAFTVIANERLNASLVDMQFRTERRVWLLSIGADGLPLLEDISGQIALAAGRGPMSEIRDIVVDTGEFASAGRIAVRPDDRIKANPGEVRRLALAEQLERERGRHQLR